MSNKSFAKRAGTRITAVLPEVHLRGKVVDERPIKQDLERSAFYVNPVTGKSSVLHQVLSKEETLNSHLNGTIRRWVMAFKITEVFGHSVEDSSPEALTSRTAKPCPFQAPGTPCTKVSVSDPLGVCMFGDAHVGTPVCPVRFIQGNQMFVDVARAAFGAGRKITVRPELRILRKEDGKKAGKVDYIIAVLGQDGRPTDFCALEVQAVYVSGNSYYPMFHEFLATGIPPPEQRGMDWLSSRKRLIYQLNLKVPVFRRWGKKFFVAVDRQFFSALPKMKRVPDIENSEVTWVLYDFKRREEDTRFSMSPADFYCTEWADVEVALREGVPPKQQEILDDVYAAMTRKSAPTAILDI